MIQQIHASTLDIEFPDAIRSFLAGLVEHFWRQSDPGPPVVIAALPSSMSPGVVQLLASGGSFGYCIYGRLDEVDGRVALEVLTDSRMRGPDHYRIWEDGTREDLPTPWLGMILPADDSPEERQRVEEDYYKHNREVAQLLRERGFP